MGRPHANFSNVASTQRSAPRMVSGTTSARSLSLHGAKHAVPNWNHPDRSRCTPPCAPRSASESGEPSGGATRAASVTCGTSRRTARPDRGTVGSARCRIAFASGSRRVAYSRHSAWLPQTQRQAGNSHVEVVGTVKLRVVAWTHRRIVRSRTTVRCGRGVGWPSRDGCKLAASCRDAGNSSRGTTMVEAADVSNSDRARHRHPSGTSICRRYLRIAHRARTWPRSVPYTTKVILDPLRSCVEARPTCQRDTPSTCTAGLGCRIRMNRANPE